MDLNYLYYRHQVSLFNAEHATCEESRLAHLSLVDAYAAKIELAKRPQAPLGLIARSRHSRARNLQSRAKNGPASFASKRRLAGGSAAALNRKRLLGAQHGGEAIRHRSPADRPAE